MSTSLTCKKCGNSQQSDGLDQNHIYCPCHTSDENDAGIGLICLCLREGPEWRGICPDCGAVVVENKESRRVTYARQKKNGELDFFRAVG